MKKSFKASTFLGFIYILSVVLIPLNSYTRILDTQVTVNRIFLFLTFLFLVVHSFKYKKSQSHRVSVLIASLLFVLPLGMSFLFNYHSSIAIIFSYLLFVLYVYVSYEVLSLRYYQGRHSQINIVFKVFFAWFGIILAASIVPIYFQYVLGISHYPVFGSDVSSLADSMRMKAMMNEGRLFLPFGTAPFLGLTSLFITIFCFLELLRKRTDYSRVLIFTVLLVSLFLGFMSKSRSAIYSFIICMALILVANWLSNLKRSGRLKGRLVIFVFFSLVLIGFINFDFDMSRLINGLSNIGESRHLAIRVSALNLIGESNIVNLVFGSGAGAMERTGVAPYTFTSYLTVLLELGVLGFLLYSFLILLPVSFAFSRKKDKAYLFKKHEITALSVYLYLSNLMYEFKTFVIFGVLIGFLLHLSQEKEVSRY